MAGAGHVMAVFGTKGGVGKTLLATNLAMVLSQKHQRPTAFLDLSASPDDSAMMLGQSEIFRLSPEATLESLPGMIAEAQGRFAFVILDVGSVLTPLAISAFEHSNLLVLVTSPDEVGLRHTLKALDLLERLRFPLRMVTVAINRAESRGNLSSRDVAQRVRAAIIAEIPSDGRLTSMSLNKGMAVVALDEHTRIAQAFQRWGQLLVENPRIFVDRFTIDRTALPVLPVDRAAVSPSALRDGAAGAGALPADPLIQLKQRIQTKLLENLDLKRLDLNILNDASKARQLRRRVEQVALDILAEEQGFISGEADRTRLVKDIVDDAIGLGPLEDLLADDEVSDVLVNGKDQIYIERRGKLSLTDKRFLSNDQVLAVIERIVARLGRRIDESNPMVDARLPDGSRVNAIIPPLSIKGPMLSIRKFHRQRYNAEDLVTLGSLTSQMADFLRMCIIARKNMIISGGTGSGKTTVLNMLSSFIPDDERIITIEDAAELRLDKEHWVALESRPPNIEGRGQVAIRDLFRNALRMRPDRIVIGECRGAEALDMLQAMNTGHDGSMTTIHANSPQDVIARLDSLVLMSNVELPVRAIREQIASAIHLIVHTARLSDGTRKVTRITEIVGIDSNADIRQVDLFTFVQQGVGPNGDVIGAYQPTGHLPSFLEELKTKGLPCDERMFRQDPSAITT